MASQQRGPRLGLEELKQATAEMRAVDLIDIFAAGSGHPGGTLSIMDIAADCFGVSGKPWKLMQWFGLSAEHIAERVLKLHGKRTSIHRLAA
jgi:transketolase